MSYNLDSISWTKYVRQKPCSVGKAADQIKFSRIQNKWIKGVKVLPRGQLIAIVSNEDKCGLKLCPCYALNQHILVWRKCTHKANVTLGIRMAV